MKSRTTLAHLTLFTALCAAPAFVQAQTQTQTAPPTTTAPTQPGVGAQGNFDCSRFAVQHTGTTTAAPATGSQTDISAQNFIACAAMGDMLEIESSKLAESRADAKSKTFAARMVKDHTMTSNELKTVAGKLNVTLPTTLDANHRAKLDRLTQAKGADFDKMYDEMQVEAHEAAVGLFETYSRSGTDSDLKAFAAKHLPALQEHLKMAQQQK